MTNNREFTTYAGTRFTSWECLNSGSWDIEKDGLTFKVLSKIVDQISGAIMNNYIMEEMYKKGFYFDLYTGNDYDDEGDYCIDIFQYFIIGQAAAEFLAEYTDEIVYYNDDLDLYIWGVTHFGTGWDCVHSDLQFEIDGDYIYLIPKTNWTITDAIFKEIQEKLEEINDSEVFVRNDNPDDVFCYMENKNGLMFQTRIVDYKKMTADEFVQELIMQIGSGAEDTEDEEEAESLIEEIKEAFDHE